MSVIEKIVLDTSLLQIHLPVSLAKPTDQYILRGADGLGPPEFDVMFGDPLMQAGLFLGSSPRDREIILRVGLNPGYEGSTISVADLRASIYSTLMSQRSVLVTVRTDSDDEVPSFVPSLMYIDAYVRRIEISAFAKDPEVQITLVCPDPVFNGPPYFSSDSGEPAYPYSYYGTAPAGYIHYFTLSEAAPNGIIIANQTNLGETDAVGIDYAFLNGDIIEYNSIPGQRFMNLRRFVGESVLELILIPYIDLDPYDSGETSVWPVLRQGLNTISIIDAELNSDITHSSSRFEHFSHYWGI